MSGRYVKQDEDSLSEYEIYEIDLSEHGVRAPAAFNTDWIPMGQRAWFLRTMNDIFERVAKEAHETGQNEVRAAMRKALGL